MFLPATGESSDVRPLAVGSRLRIEGEEARHALRVKRLSRGDPVEILDGRGNVVLSVIAEIASGRERAVELEVTSVRHVAPPVPALHVFAATPKGPRVDEMVEGLSEVGAASWTPLLAERTVVDPRPAKLDRLRRLAAESAKQSGRAWVMSIGEPARFASILSARVARRSAAEGPSRVVLAHADAEPYAPSGESSITLLIGPEGGWSPRELAGATAAGVAIASFGRHVMRIETAAVAAGAIVLDHERRMNKSPDAVVPGSTDAG